MSASAPSSTPSFFSAPGILALDIVHRLGHGPVRDQFDRCLAEIRLGEIDAGIGRLVQRVVPPPDAVPFAASKLSMRTGVCRGANGASPVALPPPEILRPRPNINGMSGPLEPAREKGLTGYQPAPSDQRHACIGAESDDKVQDIPVQLSRDRVSEVREQATEHYEN